MNKMNPDKLVEIIVPIFIILFIIVMMSGVLIT
jgi:hypothetical protein